jgi:hypothetical protein
MTDIEIHKYLEICTKNQVVNQYYITGFPYRNHSASGSYAIGFRFKIKHDTDLSDQMGTNFMINVMNILPSELRDIGVRIPFFIALTIDDGAIDHHNMSLKFMCRDLHASGMVEHPFCICNKSDYIQQRVKGIFDKEHKAHIEILKDQLKNQFFKNTMQ